MKEKLKILALISPLILVFDQLTKWLIVRFIPQGNKITIWENFFDIVHARNKGAAFGILSMWDSAYRDLFFYALAALALCFLFYFLKQLRGDQKWQVVPIALIFGGALGNIVDRLFRGSVVDFLSFHWYDRQVDWSIFNFFVRFDLVWPAFNVADSAISVGVCWLLCLMIVHQRREMREKESDV